MFSQRYIEVEIVSTALTCIFVPLISTSDPRRDEDEYGNLAGLELNLYLCILVLRPELKANQYIF